MEHEDQIEALRQKVESSNVPTVGQLRRVGPPSWLRVQVALNGDHIEALMHHRECIASALQTIPENVEIVVRFPD
jgi:hypothetical protein